LHGPVAVQGAGDAHAYEVRSARARWDQTMTLHILCLIVS
jgi:hypothetical protein